MTIILNQQQYNYIINAGKLRYWSKEHGNNLVSELPIPVTNKNFKSKLIEISLPSWAEDLGAYEGNIILVDESCLLDGAKENWQLVDWWAAAFHHLNATTERLWEQENGTIHSYSMRLKTVDSRLFDYAWVNRIFLFLRRWAAKEAGKDEDDIFGALPAPRIDLTHDVDYLKKTVPLRLKKTAFDGFNALRQLLSLKIKQSIATIFKAIKFFFVPQAYWCIPEIMEVEERYGFSSTFHFYGGIKSIPKSFKKWLLDPSYDVEDTAISKVMIDMISKGWSVGLHQSFFSWSDASSMKEQIKKLENSTGTKAIRCRQHWLRFSWDKTWQAQLDAGLKLDTTLCFNDRAGFRNGTALEFTPLGSGGACLDMRALPTVLMDSHLWDYSDYDEQKRIDEMKRWIDEVIFVHGEISIVWHQRVYHKDYGWGGLYEELLAYMKEKGAVST